MPPIAAGEPGKTKMMMDSDITLRRTTTDDLNILFTFQLDKDANYQAAFTSKDPADRAAYLQKYTRFLDDRTINMMTIIVDNVIAGSIAKFEMEGETEITYWIDKKFWGNGIATKALRKFLVVESARPIFGRVAFDGIGSQRVLEKCGFVKIGKDQGFANARGMEIEEYIYKLS